jgi:serine protease Do
MGFSVRAPFLRSSVLYRSLRALRHQGDEKMKLLRIFALLVALGGLGVVAIAAAATVSGQHEPARPARELTILAGRGAAIGVSVRDVPPAEAGGERREGVLIDEVRPGSPAEKGGLKRGDILVEFDGERVRSARQFARIVQETPAGRAVKATVMRDGRRTDVQVVPDTERYGDMTIHGDFGDHMRDFGRELGRLGDRLPPFDFNFDFDVSGASGRRLGVSVQELTTQLAKYFGARDGVLVMSVTEDSSAARAGLKAGDVITSINGDAVRSRQDLVRGLRNASTEDEVSVGIVRDRKEMTVKAKVEGPRRAVRGRPV